MAMTVGGVNSYVSNYNRVTSATQKIVHQTSTGEKFPNAATGASDYAVAVRLKSNIGATSQSIKNAQVISSAIKISEGAIENTIKSLKDIREKVNNAANDTNNTLDRQAIQKGINEIISQINENANVDYNGKKLLDGSQNGLLFYGINGYEHFQAGDLRTSTLGLTDDKGNVKIDVSTPEAAMNSLEFVDQSIDIANDTFNGMQVLGDYVSGDLDFESALDLATTQGAQQQALEYKMANLVTMEENQLGALNSLNSTDIADQSVKNHTQQILEHLARFGIDMSNNLNSSAIRGLLP